MDSVPFSRAIAVSSPDGGGAGRYQVELLRAWEADGAKQHGGVLLAVATNAALTALAGVGSRDDMTPGGRGRDGRARDGRAQEEGPGERWWPLAVSAVFVRAGSTGAAEATTEVLGDGALGPEFGDQPVRVVRSTLRQGGEVLVDTTVTAGRPPASTRPPPALRPGSRLAPAPPPELVERAPRPSGPPLASACEVVIDPSTTAYRRKERAEPAMRGWVRPRGADPDALFALFAGDIMPTGLFNFGLVGWAPTVQLTALLRAAPAPGWLRVETETRTIAGGWFDEDVTVFDAEDRLICQARQLARSPRPRA